VAATEVGHIEELLERVEALPDPAARDVALETVQALLELYGEGLTRIVEAVGPEQALALAGDELVEHLLLLHGVHPVGVEERVREALEGVRPYLGSHGGDVELLGIDDGVARIRMQGSCEGCPASTATVKLAIEDAVLKAAPDVDRVEAEGGAEPGGPGSSPLLQIEMINPAAPEPSWAQAGALPQLNGGGTLLKEVAGEPLLFLRLDGNHYAYRPRCPACEASLEEAELDGAELTCAGCGRRYDARRAGRGLDDPQLQLEPVPLLTDEAGLVRVALQAGVG
jgi:Fe-S cluster biogenesis protein NfuA/nitrite reductase/ring-hydroxylating ferredoxin subunit